MEAGDQFALGFRQVEGRPIDAGDRAREIDPEDHEREWIVQHEPVREPAALHLADRDQVHRAGNQHRHDDAHPQRHLIADHLGRLAHRPEQRPFGGRRIAGQDHAKHFQPDHGDDEEHRHIQPLPDPVVSERQGEIRGERGAEAHIRRDAEQHRVGPLGHQVFFGDQLQAVGQRLQPAEFAPDARRPEPILNPPGDLPLKPDEEQCADRDQRDQQGALNDRGQGVAEPGPPPPRIDEKLGHRGCSFV